MGSDSDKLRQVDEMMELYEELDWDVGGNEEGTLSLTQGQEDTSSLLRQQLTVLAGRIDTSKMKLTEKIKALNSLVKSHESLTKTERSVAGLDRSDSGVGAGLGVIMIPVKLAPDSWHEVAVREVEAAKNDRLEIQEGDASTRGGGKTEGG